MRLGSDGVQELLNRSRNVTALPLDSVIGAIAKRRGVEIIDGTWDDCHAKLIGRRFDCILITNLLHLQRNPERSVHQCSRLLRPGGTLLIAGPNLDRPSTRLKKTLRNDDYWKLRSYDLSGFSVCGPKTLARHLQEADLQLTETHWLNHSFDRAFLRAGHVRLGSLTAKDWVLQARKVGNTANA